MHYSGRKQRLNSQTTQMPQADHFQDKPIIHLIGEVVSIQTNSYIITSTHMELELLLFRETMLYLQQREIKNGVKLRYKGWQRVYFNQQHRHFNSLQHKNHGRENIPWPICNSRSIALKSSSTKRIDPSLSCSFSCQRKMVWLKVWSFLSKSSLHRQCDRIKSGDIQISKSIKEN